MGREVDVGECVCACVCVQSASACGYVYVLAVRGAPWWPPPHFPPFLPWSRVNSGPLLYIEATAVQGCLSPFSSLRPVRLSSKSIQLKEGV